MRQNLIIQLAILWATLLLPVLAQTTPPPQAHNLIVYYGTGSGSYIGGALVPITAPPTVSGGGKFVMWIGIDPNSSQFITDPYAHQTTFRMGTNAHFHIVRIAAVYSRVTVWCPPGSVNSTTGPLFPKNGVNSSTARREIRVVVDLLAPSATDVTEGLYDGVWARLGVEANWREQGGNWTESELIDMFTTQGGSTSIANHSFIPKTTFVSSNLGRKRTSSMWYVSRWGWNDLGPVGPALSYRPSPVVVLSDQLKINKSATQNVNNYQVISENMNTLVPIGDIDINGLPDAWEIEQFGQLDIYDAGDDPDGDGVANIDEFQNGLHALQQDSDGDGYSDPLSIGMALHLKLDENSGTIAGDSSEQGRPALISGAEWQPTGGVERGALKFNGGPDRLDLSVDVLDGATNLTFSLWFRSLNSSAVQTLLSAPRSTQLRELAILIENGNAIRFYTGSGSSVVWNIGRNVVDGRWHHLVLTRNTTSNQVRMRLDGDSDYLPQAASLGSLTVDEVVMGQLHESGGGFVTSSQFVGLVDDVRIYSQAIDAEDLLLELFRPNDLDQDGLPDDWERSLSSNLSFLGSSEDPDQDGTTNRQEFRNGTDPRDFYNGVTPVITLLSGTGQTIFNGKRTTQPLDFQVTDGVTPLANAPVEVVHLGFLGTIKPVGGDNSGVSLNLRTDSQGKISVHFQADW